MEILQKSASDTAIIQEIVESLLKDTLAQEVQRQLKNQLAEQLSLQASTQTQEKPKSFSDSYERQLFERMVRVEEELKNNQELLKAFMQQVDKRFEAMQQSMDKRFEAMQQNMDKRFEQVDKRFMTLQWFMGIGFGLIMSTLGLLKLS